VARRVRLLGAVITTALAIATLVIPTRSGWAAPPRLKPDVTGDPIDVPIDAPGGPDGPDGPDAEDLGGDEIPEDVGATLEDAELEALLREAEAEAAASADGTTVDPESAHAGSTTSKAAPSSDVLVNAAPKLTPAKPKWIEHLVVAGDRLDEIADRYGVSRESLIRWNKLDAKKPQIVHGRTLRVHAKTHALPRVERTHVVAKGDTWSGIAKKYGVDEDRLRRWNKSVPRKFKIGTELSVWVEQREPTEKRRKSGSVGGASEPEAEDVVEDTYELETPLPLKSVRGNAYSENRELYTLSRPELTYGSSHTVRSLQEAIAVWRRDYGFVGSLVITCISKPGGGKFRPHKSHQSGRDVDIRLPVKKKDDASASDLNDVDWNATWALVKTLIDGGQVQYIFLNSDRQRQLYKAALRAGAKKEELAKWIQFPQKSGTNHGIVRHADGHKAHLHVRFKCGPREKSCSMKP
jgi:LysM repeat protein